MASAVISSATVTPVKVQASLTGVKANTSFPVSRRSNASHPSKGFKVKCMQVWPPVGLKKFETLSYLPPLTQEQLAKEIDYLLREKWVPCLEFETQKGFVYRENHKSPGYYDGRYWTMWKLPMFGCTDSSQVIKELEECKKAYPNAFVRIIGFDNKRQVQCISFIAYKPPGF